LKKILNLIKIFSLNQRDYVFFYSEDSNYWVHLKPLIVSLVEDQQLDVVYISSQSHDLGLKYKNKRFRSFYLGFGSILVWFFKNIDCKILITSSPDLHNYHFKKSKNNVHYIYTQHSLCSLHSIYNHNAFSAFDTIFCSTANHIIEAEKIFEKSNKKPIFFKHGYDRFLTLPQKKKKLNVDEETVLISPSWGPSSLFRDKKKITILIENLIQENFKVILRPHHMTLRTDPEYINELKKKFSKFENFFLEKGNFNANSIAEADTLITDYSGIAFEYYFKYKGKVIFIETGEFKINNIYFKKLNLPAFEITNRDKVGYLCSYQNIREIIHIAKNEKPKLDYLNPIFNFETSDKVGAEYVKKLFIKLSG